VPRASTTSDSFNAVAEPRRRAILNYLALQERPVSDIVVSLQLAQPSVSKHLRVLRDVGLVAARRDGRQILYRTNAEAIRPLYEWTKTFERFWQHQLLRIKQRAEEKSNSLEIPVSGETRPDGEHLQGRNPHDKNKHDENKHGKNKEE
jgi:DNA-binding transcriptional ArsR family regulator